MKAGFALLLIPSILFSVGFATYNCISGACVCSFISGCIFILGLINDKK